MKKLILVRHGQYGDDGHLTEFGRMQIRRLFGMLQPFIGTGSVALMMSPLKRARDTAGILEAGLNNVVAESHDVLKSDFSTPEDFQAALALLREKGAAVDVMIWATHCECVERLPKHFGQHELGVATFPRQEIEKGEAWVIDCEQKTCVLIRP